MSSLEAAGLAKRYGRVQALADVSLYVGDGQIAGLIGPNGAGKTTAMRAILGLVGYDRGTVRIDGQIARGVVRADRIGALIDRPSVYPYLSGRANLQVAALALFGRSDQAERLTGLLARVGLAEMGDRHVRTYSTGQRQRLGIGMALVGDARILVLDEPTSGLDPAGIVELRIMLRELANEGRAVLLSSHLLHEVEQVCDVVTIIDQGRLLSAGPPSELSSADADLLVRFATAAEASAAAAALTAVGLPNSVSGPTIVVEAASARARAVTELLTRADLFPIEIRPTARGLEEAYLELTGTDRATRTNA